ncbi:MAG: hypothetical protein A2170_09255 [Deltaproteobacteria bacterium RBG_13_53_10]|nr:MAG: hypothetical protein A2170_09255 [Deltaproteobacteria bacterium RBG_13_53_10]
MNEKDPNQEFCSSRCAVTGVPLLIKRRGPIDEAVWSGHVALVDSEGNLLAGLGDPAAREIYFRSAAKPLQAVAVLRFEVDLRYGLTEREVAVMCGSHLGEPDHIAAVESLLARIDCCPGVLYPPNGVRHGCSGKHSGFLALAVQQGWPVTDYLEPEHPVQRTVLSHIAEMCERDPRDIRVARENCGAPTFGMPLLHMALGYARLADPGRMAEPVRRACGRVVSAMANHPDMIRGSNTFCTRLNKAGRGAFVGKWGATGVYGVALLRQGMGLAVKIESGLDQAAFEVVTTSLVQLGVLTPEVAGEELAEYYQPLIADVCGVPRGHTEVGEDFVLPKL